MLLYNPDTGLPTIVCQSVSLASVVVKRRQEAPYVNKAQKLQDLKSHKCEDSHIRNLGCVLFFPGVKSVYLCFSGERSGGWRSWSAVGWRTERMVDSSGLVIVAVVRKSSSYHIVLVD